jgi:hypothetical protein
MGKPRESPLEFVSFICIECEHEFSCAPARVENHPADWWHPFLYFNDCPQCGHEALQLPAERGRLKAWAHATGPRTPEGKANSAANLDGHPTPEETRITRLNALKHGQYAEVANYFPARPGQYPHCNGCRYRGKECREDPPAHHKNPPGCLLRTELFMRHQIAFETRDPGMLMDLRAGTQAAIQAIIDDMIIAIAADGGPRIKEIQWYYDKDGGFHLAQWRDEKGDEHQIYELKAHPLLKILAEFIQKNNMTLGDMGMTPKVQDEQDLMTGFLQESKNSTEGMEQYRQKTLANQEKLLDLLRRNNLPAGEVIDVTPERIPSG